MDSIFPYSSHLGCLYVQPLFGFPIKFQFNHFFNQLHAVIQPNGGGIQAEVIIFHPLPLAAGVVFVIAFTVAVQLVNIVLGLTPELLYACTDAFYRPGHMVLSVAGNITLDQAVEACRRNGVYDAVEPPQVETIFPQEADTVQHKETTFTMPVNKPCFALGYKEAAINRGDTRMEVIADLLPDLICGGLTNLYRKLYDESLVNPEFSGDYLSTEGACIIAFTGESETPREVAQMVRDEVARLRQNGVDPELFTLVKNQMYGEMLADVENVDDAAEEMGMAFLKGRTLADEIEALATLTVDDVNKALQTMLLEENSAYIQIDPKE